MTLPDHDTQHVAEARALLISEFRNKIVIPQFLDTYIRRLQDVEDMLWDIVDKRILATATAAQLDTLGALVLEIRRGRTDAQFRLAISIRIKVNRSKGGITDVIEVASLANAPNIPIVDEHRYLSFHVETYEQVGEQYLADYLNRTRAASSYGVLVASDLPQSELLCFDDAQSPIGGTETFSDAQSGTGKVAASCYGLPSDLRGVILQGAYGDPTGGLGDGILGDFVLGV